MSSPRFRAIALSLFTLGASAALAPRANAGGPPTPPNAQALFNKIHLANPSLHTDFGATMSNQVAGFPSTETNILQMSNAFKYGKIAVDADNGAFGGATNQRNQFNLDGELVKSLGQFALVNQTDSSGPQVNRFNATGFKGSKVELELSNTRVSPTYVAPVQAPGF